MSEAAGSLSGVVLYSGKASGIQAEYAYIASNEGHDIVCYNGIL